MRTSAALILMIGTWACSPKQIGLTRMADALTATATSFSRDNDIELVRDAAPSTLKLIEMVLDEQPKHAGLLMSACNGFTQYAYGFVHIDAELAAESSPALAAELRGRAVLHVRSRARVLHARDRAAPPRFRSGPRQGPGRGRRARRHRRSSGALLAGCGAWRASLDRRQPAGAAARSGRGPRDSRPRTGARRTMGTRDHPRSAHRGREPPAASGRILPTAPGDTSSARWSSRAVSRRSHT